MSDQARKWASSCVPMRLYIMHNYAYMHGYTYIIPFYYTYECSYVHNVVILYHLYIVTSSVTNTAVTLITSNVTSELYNITVTCIIHPDSTADQCVVMAMDDDGVTRTGNLACICIHLVL